MIKIKAKIDCSAFYPSITEYYDFEGNGVPFLRVNEIKDGLVKLKDSTAYLPQHILDNNKSTIAIGYPGDLIIAKGGNTLAKVGLITSQYSKYALSRDIILIRTNKLESYNRYFLWLFFHSEHGQALLWRTASQTGQPHLTLPSINEINLPKYDLDFEAIAEKLYKESVKQASKSKKSYQKAEQLLLEEIGLENFEPSKEPVNVKSFKESFGVSGRLDAEYYQVKYDKVESLLRLYNNGYSLLGEKIEYIRTGEYSESYVAKTLKSKFYLRNNNISKGQILPDDNYAVAADNFLCKAEENEILTSRVGTIGLFGVVSSYLVDSIYSDNVLCFKLTDGLNPYAYSVLFSSMPYQLLMEKLAGGSVQPLITQTSIKTLPIPILKSTVQNEAAELIEESFSLQKQSEHLLDVAKQAVEKAIAKSEEEALEWITEQTKALPEII